MTFTPGSRVRTNAAYIAAGGPRASRKPFAGVVVAVGADGRIKVTKDGTRSPQWGEGKWFEAETK